MDRAPCTGLALLDLPHAEARRLCATGAPVYLCVNPVEYHGPHLSLHNDRLICQALIARLHDRLGHPEWPLLCAADLEVGVDPCPGPGTRWSSYAAVKAVVREAVRALRELGAQRVVLMTFHGAPLHNLALHEAVRWLQDQGVQAVAPFTVVLQEMLGVDAHKYAPAFGHLHPRDLQDVLDALPTDFHAGFFETSVALELIPHAVAPMHRALPPCPKPKPALHFLAAQRLAVATGQTRLAQELGFAAEALGWMQLRPFPGYTGRPHLASARAGHVFVEEILGRYVALLSEVFAGRQIAPPPIMAWLATATLSGRIPGAQVPEASEVARF
jgi:creatinine amidohydrolase